MTADINAITRRLGGLPPDPDGMNEKRADWAANALSTFVGDTKTDAEDAVSDLLVDIMHWCDRNSTDFERELARSLNHYRSETTVDHD